MKLSIIGAGSTYTPELVHGVLASFNPSADANTCIHEISLYDIDPERLRTVGGYCVFLQKSAGIPIPITLHSNLEDALGGSVFVVIQIRVGGNQQRAADEKAIFDMGLIAQETTGAVGFLKAYRTIPVMAEIARRVQRVCPDAFLINFTNPAGIISAAIRKAGFRNVVGLCNVPIFVRKKIIELIRKYMPGVYRELDIGRETGKDLFSSRLNLAWGGLNHLSWVFEVKVDGESILDNLLDVLGVAGETDFYPVNREYARRTRTIPSPYLRYYTDTAAILREQHENGLRCDEVLRIERELLDTYDNLSRSPVIGAETLPPLPPALSLRGGADYSRLAVQLMLDVIAGKPSMEHILNVPDTEEHYGPAYEFIEVPVVMERVTGSEHRGCITGTRGEHNLCLSPRYPDNGLIPDEVRELIRRVRQYEDLTLEAGFRQDTALARKALESHPLVGRSLPPGF